MLSAKDLYQNSVPCQHPYRALIWSACLFRHCGYCTLWEKERPATEQKYRQESQSPLVLKWSMRKIIMIRHSWSIRAQSVDNCKRLRGADFAQGWRKVPRCCGLPNSLPLLWELAIKRGNQRVSVQNTSSCQNLIENCEKAQNHTFCNHSARNTFSAGFWWRLVGLQCPLPVLIR